MILYHVAETTKELGIYIEIGFWKNGAIRQHDDRGSCLAFCTIAQLFGEASEMRVAEEATKIIC